ncbi:TonB-dependent receptor [Alloprevotella sp. OH1205_COT-284]|uniref:TonB-dependent receptor n=1 Tax=Alloprevotella sp. OH1205_COT-284 TaxID=2491043 RepID=UPI000F5DB43C|nr:TonB-dependent receptor [Alloprevotella sp. OH1205_COT-284]RRD80882.1 TonB-dependent receptor [Alloprevotella sp. OH1205_COT-284]
MTKGVSVLATMWCIAGATAMAQIQKADTLKLHEDNADFTFTESQLDEDLDASQAVASVVAKNDLFLNQVGFRFSPMRFRVRALDNMYSQTYMNGLRLNDTELGRFNYASIGGMNDATRNKEGVDAYDYTTFGLVGPGGGQSLNTRASQFAQGRKISLSATNRNYYGRAMYTHATGLMANGWAFAGSVGYRGATEGVIEGTFYNSAAYFLAAEKRFGNNHALSLVTYGSPTERAQQGASTEEAYWLANSHYYNPNWGYQNGEKRNSRVVETFSPTTILTWDWENDAHTSRLTSNLGFAYNQYSGTALGWNGNAYDPRPDYYKNLPSGVGDVWDRNSEHYVGKEQFLLDQWQSLYERWTSNKANRQVNWDKMYHINRQNEAAGGEALYYQERRHNDQLVGAFSSTLNHTFNKNHKIAMGVNLNHTHGMHYKTMADLLGGTRYTDIDKFAAKDYGSKSLEAQNDLRNPNRQIKVGDRFGYDYNIDVNKADLWSNYQYTGGYSQVIVAGHIDGTTIERDGQMENGRYRNNSYGKSGMAKFLGGGGKLTLAFTPTRNHRLSLSANVLSQAPLARNAFVAARTQNNFINNLTNEDHIGFDLSYAFRFGRVVGKVSGYHTQITNQVKQTAYYNDQQSTFTYLTMSNISKAHYGVEAALEIQATTNLSFSMLASVGDALYNNNPYAQVSYEGMNPAELAKLNSVKNPVTKQPMPMRVIAKGMREDSTPLTALSAGVKYSYKGWFFEASANYYDRVYVGFSPYRRLNSTYATDGHFYLPTGVSPSGLPVFEPTLAQLENEGGILFSNDGFEMASYAAAQEKFKGGVMFDASIGRYIRLRGGKSLSINLSFQNIGNNTNLRTGGYEQNRSDFYYKESGGSYSKGEGKAYKFSKNSKYYYANAFNFFLNIGFKF